MAGRLSALLVPLLSAEAAAVDVGPAGSAECPCVNQSSEVYGFGCASHDVNGTEEYPECGDASTAPGWCGDQWCYVKLSECQVTVEPSENYPGLGWSYTTCGYRDSFSRTNITESLRGKTLRVQFLGNTGGWKGNYCTGNLGEACVDQRGFGPVQNFFDLVVGSAGIKVQQISELPEAVYAQRARLGQRSNFDLCIWATGMGFLDLCVASLVMLPRRSDASPFVSLWAEPTILVGPTVSSAEEVTFGQMLSAAFRPFSPELWLALLCVVITCSLVITYFETSQHGQFNDIRSKRLRAAEAVYRALYSLFMCESRFEPQTLGGRIVGLGLAFMCILFVCGYTATLASFLVEERRLEPNVEDLNDAIRLNKRICAHPSHILTLKVHGVPESNIVPMSVRSEILPSIGVEESSICQVGVLSEEDFVSAQATNGGSFCNLQRIGPAVGSHMVGLSVSEKWSRQLSFAIMAAAADGHLQRALRQHHPEDYCTAINLATQNTAEPEALTVQSMAGPFFVTLATVGFGHGWSETAARGQSRASSPWWVSWHTAPARRCSRPSKAVRRSGRACRTTACGRWPGRLPPKSCTWPAPAALPAGRTEGPPA
ncbi:unnamed protein product [Durusdinium trenchii]|uniref:Uncharacterized protein n=2 Tax=Durusdinium trenchii TaxID=1381693 RepID=A0ABP0KUA8_9DINO